MKWLVLTDHIMEKGDMECLIQAKSTKSKKYCNEINYSNNTGSSA